ncbi:intraflagellar transport protein 27 homolog [Sinocyclocheilus rhinocerous]|uniref:intraflagellar transport protein 27 homolog n=1 Tax=Sinocyclocheilus rhinocerous TaxID=307959 RepID=UPI0007B91650|nr:PREDICTED: intraflagellar transport protein 27 homolog [Sinocyclocheilus rhinocerous]
MVKLRARCVVVVSVCLFEKSVPIPEVGDAVEFYICDSAGREPFADACENMWNQPIRVLLGNKSDLSSRREVDAAGAQSWAQSHGLEYHETSAKEIGQYEAPFLSMARAFHSLYQDQIQIIQSLV